MGPINNKSNRSNNLIKYLLINNAFNRFSIHPIAIGCHADWNDLDGIHISATNKKMTYHSTIAMCKESCEKNANCSSFDWTGTGFLSSCDHHLYPYDISKRVEINRGSHHVVNRSNKNIKSCIGNYDGKWTDYILMNLSYYCIILFAF